jgi:hypothetical protein
MNVFLCSKNLFVRLIVIVISFVEAKFRNFDRRLERYEHFSDVFVSSVSSGVPPPLVLAQM